MCLLSNSTFFVSTLYLSLWEGNQNQKNIKMKCEKLDRIDIIKDTKKEYKNDECKSIWTKKCPICQIDLFYREKDKLNRSIRENSTCRSCSNKGKNVGRKRTEEQIIKMSNRMIGDKNPLFGKKRPKEIGEIISNRNRLLWTGKEHTESTKLKMRETALKRVIQERGCISYNRDACALFDQINLEYNWNGQHALNGKEKMVIGYSLDYYEPNLNIVIEFDEDFHKFQSEKDQIRQNKITEKLGCKFYRINENEKHLWKQIIRQF